MVLPRRRLRVSRVTYAARQRAIAVVSWIPRVMQIVRRVMDANSREAAHRAGMRMPPVSTEMMHTWKMRMYAALKPPVITIAEHGATIGFAEVRGPQTSKALRVERRPTRDFILHTDYRSIEFWLRRAASSYTAAHARRIDAIMRRAELEEETPDTIARHLLDEELAHNPQHAQMISHTNSNWSVNEGAKLGYKRAGVAAMEWLTTHDDSVCPLCASMDGKIIPLDESFADAGVLSVGDDYLNLPTDVEHPPLHPWCLIGETPVLAPDKSGAFILDYRGPVVELTLADGRELTVTPNHMLLTPAGFASASRLRNGDYVVDCAGLERIIPRHPHDQEGPTLIKNIVRALAEAPGMSVRRVPVSAEYLHGDARFGQNDIQVVAPDGLLADDFPTPAPQHAGEPQFRGADVDLLGLERSRNLAAMLETVALSTAGGVGRRRVPQAFLDREPLVSDDLSFGIAARADAYSDQPAHDDRAADRQGLGDALHRFAGMMSPAKIVKVDVRSFSGHVYDLQTRTSLYIANGILSSNCACTILPVLRMEGD